MSSKSDGVFLAKLHPKSGYNGESIEMKYRKVYISGITRCQGTFLYDFYFLNINTVGAQKINSHFSPP